jgi:hypothetical protein
MCVRNTALPRCPALPSPFPTVVRAPGFLSPLFLTRAPSCQRRARLSKRRLTPAQPPLTRSPLSPGRVPLRSETLEPGRTVLSAACACTRKRTGRAGLCRSRNKAASPALEGLNERKRKTPALLGTGSLFVPARGLLKRTKGRSHDPGLRRKEGPGWFVMCNVKTRQPGNRRARQIGDW